MTDREQLEQEIRKNCGEEYLNLLRVEGKKYRRKKVLKAGRKLVIWMILVLVLFVAPIIYVSYKLPDFRALAKASTIQGSVNYVTKDELPEIWYYFHVDEVEYTGSSVMSQRDGEKYQIGDSVEVYYYTDKPERNRAVKELSPIFRLGFVIYFSWFCLFIYLPCKVIWNQLTQRLRKYSPEQLNVFWIEYITSTDNASPRAWFLHCVERPELSDSSEAAMSCGDTISPSRMNDKEFDFIGDRFLVHDNLWSLRDYFLQLKYAYQYLKTNKTKPGLLNVYAPKKISSNDGEAWLGISFPLLKELADNGLAKKPDFVSFQIDLKRINEKTALIQQVKQNRLSYKIYMKYYFTDEARECAVDKALEEHGFLKKNDLCEIQKKFMDSESRIDRSPLSDVEGLKYQYNLLYIFFEKPWRSDPLVKEMKYIREDGEPVILCLDFQPGEYIKVSRKFETENCTTGDPALENNKQDDIPTFKVYELLNETRCLIEPVKHKRKEYMQVSWTLPALNHKGDNNKSHKYDKVTKDLIKYFEIKVSRHSSLTRFFYQALRFIPYIFSPFLVLFPDSRLNHLLYINVNLAYRKMLSRFLSHQGINDEILNIFEGSLCSIHLKNRKWTLLFDLGDGNYRAVKFKLQSLVLSLNKISSNMDQILPDFCFKERIARTRRNQFTFVVIGMMITLFLYCIYYNYTTINIDGYVFHGPIVSILSALMLTSFYWIAWIRNHLRENDLTDKFFMMLFGLIASFCLLAPTLPLTINRIFDVSQPTQQSVTIIRKKVTDGHSCLIISPLGSKNRVESIAVDEDLYRNANPDKHNLILNQHSGCLGFRWYTIEGLIEKEQE